MEKIIRISSEKKFKIWTCVISQECGATFVAANALVTTARCLRNHEENRWSHYEEVVVVKSDFTKDNWSPISDRYSIHYYIIHELFKMGTRNGDFDVAVMKIQGTIDLMDIKHAVLPICSRDVLYPEGIAMGTPEFMSYPKFLRKKINSEKARKIFCIFFIHFCYRISRSISNNITRKCPILEFLVNMLVPKVQVLTL